jgi:hypothetical protein
MHWMAFCGGTIFNHKGCSLDLSYVETLKLKNDYFIFGFSLIIDFMAFVLLIYVCFIVTYHLFSSSTLFNWRFKCYNVFSKVDHSLCHTNLKKENNHPKKKFKTYLASIMLVYFKVVI